MNYIIAAALIIKKKLQNDRLARFDLEHLPQLLVESLSRQVENEGEYQSVTNGYNTQRIIEASRYVPPIPPGQLGHFDITCITSSRAFPSLCHYSYDNFNRLHLSLSLNKGPNKIILTGRLDLPISSYQN